MWNPLVDWIYQNTLKSSSDILVTNTINGTTLALRKKAGTSTTVSTSTPVSASSQQYFAVNTLNNSDYVKAYPLTIAGSGSFTTCSFASGSVYIAKHNHMRTSVTSDKFDGMTIGYSSITDNSRTAASGSVSEVQVVLPRRYTTLSDLSFGYSGSSVLTGSSAQTLLNSGCVIKALPISTGLMGGDNLPITWEESSIRVWARRKFQ
jgi:hypothetical protein